ncbi:hypothetical protein [Geodermatophilus marinus]|uniref:hypothetical protein n=1 Tax=Geodermatophilus sp. LHW52908 TaxID=2303986 RepID=UPI000E3E328B|nr:hypothetical protein [Geodermatophilus sp. LHW52908]RFU22560.1 hypothetical protein D0Z06_04775 [Geodermatophilus sp. LHW52908]
MAPPISDAVVVDVLRRVDRLTRPLVRRLGRPPARPQAERDRWWAHRLPRVLAVTGAAPRFIGKLADLLPLQNAFGAAAQSLVVGGVAVEHAVDDPAERVALLARVLLARDLPADRVRPLLAREKGVYAEEALGPRDRRAGVRGNLRTLWRVARLLSRIDDALDARPKGKLRHRALSNLPVVGVLGGYAAERQALLRAAAAAAAAADGSRAPGDPAVQLRK